MKLLRYLAALAPLTLGVALSGCGGLLGAVNGEAPTSLPLGPSRLTPAPTPITVPGSFTVTGTCPGVTAARVVFITPAATAGAAPTITPITTQTTTLSGNSYSISVSPSATERFTSGGLWAVQTTNALGINVIAFVPPANTGDTVIAADCSTAQTVATGLLLQQITPGFVITRELAAVIAGLGAGAGNFTFTRPVTTNPATLLQAVGSANLLNQISALTFAPAATGLFTGESEILTVTATVNGVPGVAVPVTFTNSNTAVLQTIPIGGNQIFVKALGPKGAATIRAAAGNRTADLVITGLGLHPQGHAQGGGGGL